MRRSLKQRGDSSAAYRSIHITPRSLQRRWESIPDPRCGAPEASVAETRGRALDDGRRNVGGSKLTTSCWQSPARYGGNSCTTHGLLALMYIYYYDVITKLYMMHLPVHVCNGLASPADAACHSLCNVKFVKSFATWQHLFDVDSIFFVSCSFVPGTTSLKMCTSYKKSWPDPGNSLALVLQRGVNSISAVHPLTCSLR